MDNLAFGETVDERPAFRRVLDLAAESAFDILLVFDLDRITRARKSAEGAMIFDHFRDCGTKIATPGQGIIDLTDEDQDLLVSIKREMARWENRKRVARCMRGKRQAARRGRARMCFRDP